MIITFPGAMRGFYGGGKERKSVDKRGGNDCFDYQSGEDTHKVGNPFRSF